MKLRNKKTGRIGDFDIEHIKERGCFIKVVRNDVPYYQIKRECETLYYYDSLAELNEDWEDYKPAEPLIKDEKIRKLVRELANYNKTESVYAYNLVFDHAGVCIQNALVRFYDPRLRTNIDVWFQTKAPTFKKDHEYSITELCGEEEE